MLLIPDDPIVACMERTGYPPWMRADPPDWEEEEFQLQLRLREIRKGKRKNVYSFPALTAKGANTYFNAEAARVIGTDYIKWLVSDRRVFVTPAQERDENAYHIRQSKNIFVPREIREFLGNGVYQLVPYLEYFELKKGKGK